MVGRSTISPKFRRRPISVVVAVGLLPSAFQTPVSTARAAESAATVGGSVKVAPSSTAADGESSRVPYLRRHLPEEGTLEFGFFGGAFFVSPGHSLRSPGLEQRKYAGPAFETGARLSYYPLAALGVEAELSLGDGRFSEDLSEIDGRLVANRGNLFAYRAHLVGQLPFWSIVPYGLVGVGALGASSQVQGRNTDFVFHFGGGVKVPLTSDFALRAEFRENLHNRTNQNFGGIAFSEEITLGAAFRWGGRSVGPHHLPDDRDRDGLSDDLDACPDVASLSDDGCPVDSDGDGLMDPRDACPTQSGTLENGCPDLDADGDSVPVPCDRCPEVKGIAPLGCQDEDPDNDGVSGSDDECPTDAEVYNGYEDVDGCPDEVPKEVERVTGTMQGITFAQGRAAIQKSSEVVLHSAAEVLKKHPGIRVEVSGHTSSEGNSDFNLQLSEDRANAVRNWLIRAGVPEEQLEARGAGSTEPMGDNATQQGRRTNRRIEFRILNGAPR